MERKNRADAVDACAAMSKSKILAEVEAIVFARLFGGGPWLTDRETGLALQRRLEQLGLEERVPGTSDRRNTLLGRELHFDLLMVFLGLWDEWEISGILEDHGLIDWQYLEDFAERRASREMTALLARVPHTAVRHRNGRLEEVDLDVIEAGDRLVVRKGDVVPVDGAVIEGLAVLDQSALTGEFAPVQQKVGDGAERPTSARPSIC
jgi:hypothetical protein